MTTKVPSRQMSSGSATAGHVLTADGSGNSNFLAATKSIDVGAAVTTTGAAFFDLVVPAGAKQFSVNFVGNSLNAVGAISLLMGTAAAFETSGYNSTSSFASSAVGTGVNAAAVLTCGSGTLNAADTFYGSVTFTLVNAATNTWSYTVNTSAPTLGATFHGSGGKALSDTITRIRVTTLAGSSNFDAGIVNLVALF